MGNKVCISNNMGIGNEYGYKMGYCVKSIVLSRVLDMKEDERVELLKLLEDYHKESQTYRKVVPHIDTHRFIKYNEELKDTCFFCFTHKRLHFFRT